MASPTFYHPGRRVETGATTLCNSVTAQNHWSLLSSCREKWSCGYYHFVPRYTVVSSQLIYSVVHSYCAENLNELKNLHIDFIYFHSCICRCLSEKEQLMQVSCEQVDRRQVEPAVLYSNFLSILVALLWWGWAVRPESQSPGSHRCTKCTTAGLHRPRHPSLYWQ